MKKLICLTIIFLLSLTFAGCGISESELDSAQETAYDLGYDNGYAFGYSAGYTDCSSGRTDVNVFSDVGDDEDASSYAYFIVDDDEKTYHTGGCSDMIGKQLWYFKDSSLAESAGFDPCEKCCQ